MVYYITALKTRVGHVVNSSLAEDQPAGVVWLKLCITKDGSLKYAKVSKSSGQENLDNLSAELIKNAFPFVPFPKEVKEHELWFDMPVVFDHSKKIILSPSEDEYAAAATVSTAAPYIVPEPVLYPSSKVEFVIPKGLKECLQIGLNNYLPTKIAREQMDLAKLKVTEAERNFYPAFTGEYKNADGKTITDPYQSISYGLQAEQMLIGLNQVRDTVRREEIGIYMARRNYDKVQQDLLYEITKAYYELVSQNIMLKHWQETLQDLNSTLELLQKLYEGGLVIAADFENAQSQCKLITYQVISAESAVYLAKVALLQAMNIDASKIDQLSVPLEFGFEAQDLRFELVECINLGLRYRPEVELWRMTCKSAKISEVINRREGLPKFSLASSYGRSGEAYANQKLDLTDEWSLMGRLTWLWGPSSMEVSQSQDKVLSKQITDTTMKTQSLTSDVKFALFDKLNYYTAIKEANVTYHQSLHEFNETKKKVIYEVKEAYFAYNRALSGIRSSLARLTFRENEFKIVKARTEAGEGSFTEIVEAKVNLANEKSAYLRSLGEYYLAIAALDRATSYQLHLKS